MRILNLYAGIGGNRKLWKDVSITAVELDLKIANVYKDLYPTDNVIVADAHDYLLDHYHEYDFIWSSPPCQTHSSMRQNLAVRFRGTKPKYPDMKLYQEIIFLQYNFNGLWVVENVIPYYDVLIPPIAKIQRHLFWSNFYIKETKFKNDTLRSSQINDLQIHNDIFLDKYKLSNKRQILRNCVYPYLGKYILEQAQNPLIQRSLI